MPRPRKDPPKKRGVEFKEVDRRNVRGKEGNFVITIEQRKEHVDVPSNSEAWTKEKISYYAVLRHTKRAGVTSCSHLHPTDKAALHCAEKLIGKLSRKTAKRKRFSNGSPILYHRQGI